MTRSSPTTAESEAAEISINYQADLVLQDDEWFTFTLAEATLINVSAKAPALGTGTLLRLSMVISEYAMASFSFGDDGVGVTGEAYQYLPAGEYFLWLSGFVYSDTRTYSISVSTEAFPDAALEPNDTLQTATEIELGPNAREAFLPEGDEDWYTFTLEKAQILTFNFGETYSHERTLYNSKIEEYEELHMSSVPTLALEPDTYYLYLRPYEDMRSAGVGYSLGVSSQPIPDKDFEPNNSFSQATEITLPFSGDFFTYKADEDWFSFTLDKEQLVTLNRKNSPSFYPLIGAIYEDTGEMRREFMFGTSAADSFVLPAGTYRLSLRLPDDADTYNGRGLSYPLTISKEDVPQIDYEPNDTFENAQEVALGFSQDALLLTEDDSDIFRFTLEETKHIAITLQAYENGFPYMSLHNEQGELVDEAYQGSLSRVLTAGTYYLELMGYFSGHNRQVRLKCEREVARS